MATWKIITKCIHLVNISCTQENWTDCHDVVASMSNKTKLLTSLCIPVRMNRNVTNCMKQSNCSEGNSVRS